LPQNLKTCPDELQDIKVYLLLFFQKKKSLLLSYEKEANRFSFHAPQSSRAGRPPTRGLRQPRIGAHDTRQIAACPHRHAGGVQHGVKPSQGIEAKVPLVFVAIPLSLTIQESRQ
jgi:hypothetical protein